MNQLKTTKKPHFCHLLILMLLAAWLLTGCSAAKDDAETTEAADTPYFEYEWIRDYDSEMVYAQENSVGFYLPGDSGWNNTLLLPVSEEDNGEAARRYAEIFLETAGYHMLIIDGTDPVYDSWIQYIKNRTGDDSEILLAGISGIAMNALNYAGTGWSDNIKAIIADSPLVSSDETCEFLDPVLAAAEVPILFIYSRTDELQEQDIHQQLYTRCAGPKEMYLIREAAHGNGWAEDYELYEKRVTAFANNHMNDGVNAEAICCDPELFPDAE